MVLGLCARVCTCVYAQVTPAIVAVEYETGLPTQLTRGDRILAIDDVDTRDATQDAVLCFFCFCLQKLR